MKPLYILLVVLFFSQSYCDDTKKCDFFTETTGVEDCNSRLDPNDSTFYRCCFVDVADGEIETCTSVTKELYDDIDGTIKRLEDDYGIEDVKIDCNSNYIILSLLSLILLLS